MKVNWSTTLQFQAEKVILRAKENDHLHPKKKAKEMAAQHKLINQNCDFTPGTNANQYYYSIRLIYIFPRPLIHHPRKLNATWQII